MKNLKRIIAVLIIISTLASVFVISASAAGTIAYGAATVDATTLNIRSAPGTDKSIVGTVKGGNIVVILEQTSEDWYKINYHGKIGYVSTDYLIEVLTAENFKAEGTVNGTGVRVRSKPNTSASIVATYSTGTKLNVIGINSGWYKVSFNGTSGYIRSDLMDITGAGNAANTTVTTTTSSGTTSVTVPSSGIGSDIANKALSYLGYSYVYGGESPSGGFDCSGLVYYVCGQLGYSVHRTASQQYKYDGVAIDKADLEVGDLVFFSSNGSSVTHVGIYIGNDQFVHASTSKTGVIISDLNSSYYLRVWFGAKRLA